jgi:hypothetical protein
MLDTAARRASLLCEVSVTQAMWLGFPGGYMGVGDGNIQKHINIETVSTYFIEICTKIKLSVSLGKAFALSTQASSRLCGNLLTQHINYPQSSI